jgi:hypothetical protein
MTPEDTTRLFDLDELRELVDQVHDGYESAPGWVRTILLAMIGVCVLVVILRIARSVVGRLIGILLAAGITALLRFNGPDALTHVSGWLP